MPSIAELIAYLQQVPDPEHTKVYLTEEDVEEPGEFVALDFALSELTPADDQLRKYALTSPQGTACAETVLLDIEFTPEARTRIEQQFCKGGPDDPVPGTWTDVTDNDAL